MFNITILKLKDIIKFFLLIIIFILIYVLCSNLAKNKLNNNSNSITNNTGNNQLINKVENKFSIFQNFDYSKILDHTLPKIDNKKEEKINQNDVLKAMLKTQVSSTGVVERGEAGTLKSDESKPSEQTDENKSEAQENSENVNNTNNSIDVSAQTGVATQVITKNPIAEKSNAQYNNVKIKNETDYMLTEDMLKPDITIENKNIIIFHTHSCESYTPSEKYQYTSTGNFRTTDLNFTVTRVGTELEEQLKKYGFNVVHNKDYHDYPSYNGSYTRSLKTVENILQNTPTDIIIDLHRDAVGARSDYAPTVKIGDEEAAQIMFVIGTNDGGLWHPNWNQNLKFAIKLQEKAEELYPGLFKPIMLTKSRYNQHTGKYANIMEVGATGNTLDQCLNSMKYLAKIMSEIKI